MAVAACGKHGDDDGGAGSGSAVAVHHGPTTPYVATNLPRGLDVRLSNGTQGLPAADHSVPVAGTKLSDAALAPLFARMKPIAVQAGDQKSFALRPGSQPPPKVGETVHDSFPAPPSSSAPPAVDAGPLRVLRYAPEGSVPLAPQLTITFNQPMVAVTSQDDAAQTVPVTLTPQPKGRWRWIGTKTLVFDPDVRFAQATTFHVDIPAGTKSATGGALDKAVAFGFETPPPQVTGFAPTGIGEPLDPPMFVMFDQKIDPQTVLASIKVTARRGGFADPGAPFALKLLTPADIAKERVLADMVAAEHEAEHDGRWLVVRTAQPLPKDSQIDVTFAAGLAGAEGPNKTKTPQSFSFRTYGPFAVAGMSCQTGCPPNYGFSVQFTNRIDAQKVEPAPLVSIKPAITDLHVDAQGSSIRVAGQLAPRTTYHMAIKRALTDEYGQMLAKDTELDFTTGDARPMFYGPNGMIVLDPARPKSLLDFYTTNYDHLNVRMYAVEPGDYGAFRRFVDNQWNHDTPPPAPGRLVVSRPVSAPRGANLLSEVDVDLADALHHDRGDVVAVVEPSPWKTEDGPPPRYVTWVQATKLGLDAHYDADSLIAYVSDLATGAPVAGASVTFEGTPDAVNAMAMAPITATTDAQGVAKLALPISVRPRPAILVAQHGDDHAFLASESGQWLYGGYVANQLTWYVADDRGMYRPGETVSLKGWLREVAPGKGGDVGPLDSNITEVAYRLVDSQNNELSKGTTKLGKLGGFDFKLTLPATPNLGSAHVELTAGGQTTWHVFEIEEFRRPEFEVTAHAGAGPFVVADDGADVTVDAKYYAGGPLAGADVRWSVSAQPTSFAPPNHDDFSFGRWTPWWGYYGGFGADNEDDDDDNGTGSGSAAAVKRRVLPSSWQHLSKTDAAGAHVLHLDFASVDPAVPYQVRTQADVSDVNHQTWSATTQLIVHPSADYVGVRAAKSFVAEGTPFDVDAIGVDVDGKPVLGAAISVRTARWDYEYRKGKYHRVERDVQTCQVTSAALAQACHFQTPHGGTYHLVATIADARKRPSRTELTYWVAGGTPVVGGNALVGDRVTLVPDKKTYAVGDTAEVFVDAPFYPAEAIVTWRRSGIVQMARMTLAAAATVKVPITDALVPNVFVHVDVVGEAPRQDENGDPIPNTKRPAYASGSVNLSIPPATRTLGVTIAPAADKIGPGETTSLAITVVDAAGKPVANADVAVLAVDESVLALSNHTFMNPVDLFYGQRSDGSQDEFSRALVRLEGDFLRQRHPSRGFKGHAFNAIESFDGDFEFAASMETPDAYAPGFGANGGGRMRALAMPVAAAKPMATSTTTGMQADDFVGTAQIQQNEVTVDGRMQTLAHAGALGGLAAAGQPVVPITVRSNFDPLAIFAPATTTDAAGKAIVALTLPDNLTRYRLVAIAAAGAKQFGKGESVLTARLPLMVRPSAPRFLNYGDEIRLPVAIQNQTDAPMTVDLGARATNAVLTDGAGREVTVPANDRVLVELPMAAQLPGTARVQLVGIGSQGGVQVSDAAEVSLPVWTPATTEAFATYGVIDKGAIAQPVALPGKIVPAFGGIDVTTSSSALTSLTDALLYVVHYPFECAEQRASRIVSIAELRDVLTEFHADGLPSADALAASVADDVEHLQNMQNGDGGFAYWDRGYRSEPYLTVFVTDALVRARQHGFAIKPFIIQRAGNYLRSIEAYYPAYYDADTRHSISAYALAVRAELAERDVAKARALYKESGAPDKLPFEANGWLLDAFARDDAAKTERAAILHFLGNHVSETAGAANFVTSYTDGGHVMLASDQRTDGVILAALIAEQPDNDLIPKVVTGLLAHRKAGRWGNTQENSFSLIALDSYFNTYEKVMPHFAAKVWLGGDYAGEHRFDGRVTQQSDIAIAMADVATHDRQLLTIQKDGDGRLYYRIGMTYAPASLQLPPVDDGFTVQRRYEAIDDPADVTHAADGSWHVKIGARVRIRVSMVNTDRRYHVALVDPLPAGLEAMNPAIAVTGAIPADPAAQNGAGRYWWFASTWYEHQNLRDERAEAFASLVWEGVHEYTYVARATTPGHYNVPPPKAEEMYAPETFGRGASDRVTVE